MLRWLRSPGRAGPLDRISVSVPNSSSVGSPSTRSCSDTDVVAVDFVHLVDQRFRGARSRRWCCCPSIGAGCSCIGIMSARGAYLQSLGSYLAC